MDIKNGPIQKVNMLGPTVKSLGIKHISKIYMNNSSSSYMYLKSKEERRKSEKRFQTTFNSHSHSAVKT